MTKKKTSKQDENWKIILYFKFLLSRNDLSIKKVIKTITSDFN